MHHRYKENWAAKREADAARMQKLEAEAAARKAAAAAARAQEGGSTSSQPSSPEMNAASVSERGESCTPFLSWFAVAAPVHSAPFSSPLAMLASSMRDLHSKQTQQQPQQEQQHFSTSSSSAASSSQSAPAFPLSTFTGSSDEGTHAARADNSSSAASRTRYPSSSTQCPHKVHRVPMERDQSQDGKW
jgi:hypothetical protein